ncbi:hypothetical protein FRC06_000989, partial [Ceratobasidium sp. 370]
MENLSVFALPSELWVAILLKLECPDLRQCQLTCRTLHQIITSDCEISFRLELDAAGYAPSGNPRTDITAEEKLAIFRAHLLRRRTLTPYDHLVLTDGPMLSSDPDRFLYGGVFAWYSTHFNGPSSRLDFMQLASPNKGTETRQWGFREESLLIKALWIEPKYDLMVFFGQEAEIEVDDTGYFYLRTLSSNKPHPSILMHRISGSIPNSIQFVGQWMVGSYSERLVIWDWTTGDILLDKRIPGLDTLSFLSEHYFVIPQSTLTHGSKNHPMGSLDVYSLQLGKTSSLVMSMVASLKLPVVERVPLMRYEPRDQALAVELECCTDSAYQPVTKGKFVQGPPSVFEVSNTGRILRLRLRLPYDFGLDDWEYAVAPFSSLCIRVQSILRMISQPTNDRTTCLDISWSDWSAGSRWIHHSGGPGDLGAASGTRLAVLSLFQSNELYPGGQDEEAGFELLSDHISILDFHPAFLDRARLLGLHDKKVEGTVDTNIWKYQPQDCNKLTPGFRRSDKWMGGASEAIAPYAAAQFRDEELYDVASGWPTVWADDEHWRANVGKSSLLNSVLGRKDLVKTSSKAGHTRALNFFQVGTDARRLTLVDAPGYGERGRPEWGEVFEHYIGTRQSLRRIFVLINAKHGMSSPDEAMLRDLDTRFKNSAGLSFTYQVVLTKMDCVPSSQLGIVPSRVARDTRKVAPTVAPEIMWTSAARR